MNRGTEVYFVWEVNKVDRDWAASIVDLAICGNSAGTKLGDYRWEHEKIGRLTLLFQKADPEIDALYLRFIDIELLPELAFMASGKFQSEVNCRDAYNWIKRLFVLLEADICSGASSADEVGLFDFEDQLISRLFRFVRDGTQFLIAPYEDGREISSDDLAVIRASDSPNWVVIKRGDFSLGD